MPPGHMRYFMANGSPSTPAPTMAVVLWNALYHLRSEVCCLSVSTRDIPFLAVQVHLCLLPAVLEATHLKEQVTVGYCI